MHKWEFYNAIFIEKWVLKWNFIEKYQKELMNILKMMMKKIYALMLLDKLEKNYIIRSLAQKRYKKYIEINKADEYDYLISFGIVLDAKTISEAKFPFA